MKKHTLDNNKRWSNSADAAADFRTPLFRLATLWGGALLILLATQTASAGLRCDCTEVVDTCSANVSLEGMQVEIESDSKACSRVDYLIEGQPFSALVVGGSTQLNWPGQPLKEPTVVIENCRVCAEAGGAAGDSAANAADAAAEPSDRAAEAIIKVMPVYPRDAWTNNVEGEVTIQFNVSNDGVVEKIKVIRSTDPVFITSSIDAISRFRFSPAIKDGKAVATEGVREKFRFRIPDGSSPTVTSAAL